VIGNTYLPPPVNELPIPPMKLSVPNVPAQNFHSQHQGHSGGGHASSHSSASGGGYSYQNQNVHIIHDCGKGPQLSQSYGTPLGQPLESYEPPQAQQLHELSSNYEIPSGSLLVPQHNQIDFNSPSNSYGPPASGPASLDVIGLESHQRANTIVHSEHQQLASAGSTISNEILPGLSSGLGGLNFVSAQKSHSIDVPSQGAQDGSYQYQLQFTNSQSAHGNGGDAPDHQQILADGLLQSILSAVEQKPSQTVPQVVEHDQERDHSEVQVFLKSPQGQDVLADKSASS
jgi:hypothetical protein